MSYTKQYLNKGRDIISQALTPQLKSALETELKDLNASHLPLSFELKQRKGLSPQRQR